MIKFTETQTFPALVYAALGLGTVFSLGGLATVPRPPFWLWPYVGVSLSLAFNLLFLRTGVTDREVTLTFGWLFPLYRRRIAVGEIVSAEAVTYSPLAEYGGWGIKWGRSGTALNARGNEGVRLMLRDGKRVLIGSQRASELAEALRPTGPQ